MERNYGKRKIKMIIAFYNIIYTWEINTSGSNNNKRKRNVAATLYKSLGHRSEELCSI